MHTVSWWWTFLSSYIKFLQIIKETGQAVYHISPWSVTLTMDLFWWFWYTALCDFGRAHSSLRWQMYAPNKPAAHQATIGYHIIWPVFVSIFRKEIGMYNISKSSKHWHKRYSISNNICFGSLSAKTRIKMMSRWTTVQNMTAVTESNKCRLLW